MAPRVDFSGIANRKALKACYSIGFEMCELESTVRWPLLGNRIANAMVRYWPISDRRYRPKVAGQAML